MIQDGKLTVEQMETVADAVERKVSAALFEAMFPGYELENAGVMVNSINRQLYIRVAMRRKPGKQKIAPVRKGAGAVSSFLSGTADKD